MRFTRGFLDMLVIKEDGLTDYETIKFGKVVCKANKSETRFFLRLLKSAGLIEKVYSKRNGELVKVWKIKKPKSAILAGLRNDAQSAGVQRRGKT